MLLEGEESDDTNGAELTRDPGRAARGGRGRIAAARLGAPGARAAGDGQGSRAGAGPGEHRALEWALAADVRRWVGRFVAGGIPALADAPRPGRPAVADASYRRAAEAALEAGPRALGLPFDVWTSARLATYLERETGVRVAPGWLRALLGHWEWACGRPQHTLKHLQDPAAVAACQEELATTAGKSGSRTGALRIPSPG